MTNSKHVCHIFSFRKTILFFFLFIFPSFNPFCRWLEILANQNYSCHQQNKYCIKDKKSFSNRHPAPFTVGQHLLFWAWKCKMTKIGFFLLLFFFSGQEKIYVNNQRKRKNINNVFTFYEERVQNTKFCPFLIIATFNKKKRKLWKNATKKNLMKKVWNWNSH